MNQMIQVRFESERPTVSGRELHKALGIKTAYKDWFPRMCEYGFVIGTDYNSLKNEQVRNEGGRQVTRVIDDAQLTIDMAKELCMIQRTDIGRKFRQYFIQVEKDWNSPEKIMARALQIAQTKISDLTGQIKRDHPKVLFADAVAASDAPMLIGELAKVLRQNGVDTGEKRLFEWLRSNGYLIRRKGTDYNAPTQRSMELELFQVKETAVTHSDGHITINRTTKVTGKGQQYFINKFLGGGDAA